MMEDSFEQLINALSITPLSMDILQKLTLIIEQQTLESFSSFISQSLQSLLILEQWAWQQFSHDFSQWCNQSYYLNLFSNLASFNKNLIFNNDYNEIETKALLILPNSIDEINNIFEQINQSNDDNDQYIAIISLWFDNLSFFIYENPQFDTLPIISHINQYIIHNYLLTDKFKFYLTQLSQLQLSQTIFSIKQLFYIKTCSFSLSSYLASKGQNSFLKPELILYEFSNEFLQIINIHSPMITPWSNELLACIAHFTGFIFICYWWGGEKVADINILFPTEKITCDFVQQLIQIISYKPFYKKIKSMRSNNETILLDNIFRFLLHILQSQNINWFFRSNITLPDILMIIAENSSYELICLYAYGMLGEILTDEKLKELKVTDSIADFFYNMLQKGWHHPLKKYKHIPVAYLLRGFLSLSKSDAIQQKIANSYRLSLFIEMCEQYPIIFDILWALSFNKDIQQQLRLNSIFMSKLSHQAKDNDNEQMRKIIHGIMWNIGYDNQERLITEINNEKIFDIMISYSHKDKILCKQIYDELIKFNYRVWIDFDQMHGNVMDAMAQAIEKSYTIIICMSEEYRKGNYCRAEAQYAFQRQRRIIPILLQKHYKPDGWLLFLIGQLLYIDFTKYEFSRAMEMLFKELKVTDISENDIVTYQQSKHDTIVTPLILSMSPSKSCSSLILPKNMLEWTQIQVQEWLIEHKLIQMSHLFSDCNGQSLLYLDDFIRNGDIKQILTLLQEDSLRKTGQTLSLTELSCFRFLIDEQKRLMQLNVPTRLTKTKNTKQHVFCCRIM